MGCDGSEGRDTSTRPGKAVTPIPVPESRRSRIAEPVVDLARLYRRTDLVPGSRANSHRLTNNAPKKTQRGNEWSAGTNKYPSLIGRVSEV